MQIERRALYNSLRANWLQDPSLKVESWQVDNYRDLRFEALFDKLKQKEIFIDRVSFLALAETVDTPEELADHLLADANLSIKEQDQIYLSLFELWRRLIPEKPCLSVFCDELDYQIALYDQGKSNFEALQDTLANLKVILDENTDEGVEPLEIFQFVCSGCANDIESFLYDFIAEQIDNQNESYAVELLDAFNVYIRDARWFEFLKVRILSLKDSKAANQLIRQLVEDSRNIPDLEFNLEVLSCIARGGERPVFVKLVKQTIKLLEVEEDFQDLLRICADYYRLLDHDLEEQKIHKILSKRSENDSESFFEKSDPQVRELLQIVS